MNLLFAIQHLVSRNHNFSQKGYPEPLMNDCIVYVGSSPRWQIDALTYIYISAGTCQKHHVICDQLNSTHFKDKFLRQTSCPAFQMQFPDT